MQLRQEWIDQAVRNAGDRPWAVVQRPRGARRILATVDLDFLLALARATGLTNQPPEETIDVGKGSTSD